MTGVIFKGRQAVQLENEALRGTVLKDGGHTMAAGGLRSTLELPDRQKAGVVGTALQAVSFLTGRD